MVASTPQRLQEELRAARQQLEEAVTLIQKQAEEIRVLKQILTGKDKQIFGPRTEALDHGQLSLYEPGLVGVAPESSDTELEVATSTKKRKKPGHGRSPFPEHLPREDIECDVPESERRCSCCGEALQPIGEDLCERAERIPPQLRVLRYHKRKYACPHGHEVRTGEAPAALLDRCKYEPSVFAHLAVAKYADHLPLHRQQAQWKRLGVDLSRSTMWDMLQRVDEIAAAPLLKECRRQLLLESLIQADETTVPVVTQGQKGSKTGYFWMWLSGTKRLVAFTTGRGRDGPRKMLGDWKGTLVTDGYSGYAEVASANGIVRAGCWAHARRKFKEDLDTGSSEPRAMLRWIGRLFGLERACRRRAEARGLEDTARLDLVARVRSQRSRRVLEKIQSEAARLRQLRSCTPKSKLAKALTYLENQWLALTVFLDDARVPVDNNACERALRPLVVGRKNWQVAGSARGAEVAANLYSLIGTCKALDIDPEKYLADVLVAVSTTPESQVARLTPWEWIESHPEARLS